MTGLQDGLLIYECIRHLQASCQLAGPKLCASLLRCMARCHKCVCASVKVWRYSEGLAYRGQQGSAERTAGGDGWKARGRDPDEWHVKKPGACSLPHSEVWKHCKACGHMHWMVKRCCSSSVRAAVTWTSKSHRPDSVEQPPATKNHTFTQQCWGNVYILEGSCVCTCRHGFGFSRYAV